MYNRRHSFRASDSSTILPTASGAVHAPVVDLVPAPPGTGVTLNPAAKPSSIGHDLACGIMAGVIETANVFVTPDAISTIVPGSQSTKAETNWLKLEDPLGRLAAECYQARQKMVNANSNRKTMPWERAKEIRERESASGVFRTVRQRVFDLLKTRGVLAEAERRGYRVVVEG